MAYSIILIIAVCGIVGNTVALVYGGSSLPTIIHVVGVLAGVLGISLICDGDTV